MDDIDALFGTTTKTAGTRPPAGRYSPSMERPRGGDAAPWDDGGPSEQRAAERRPVRGVETPFGGEQAFERQQRSAPVVAPSVTRTPAVRQVYGEQATRTAPATAAMVAPQAADPYGDEPGAGWEGGEEEPRGQQAPTGVAGKDGRDFYSVHIYGGKSALCFGADTTRSIKQGEEGNTVRLEAAPASGPRAYNWQDKVAVQFTTKELPMVLAVFMGWMPSVTFKAHGPAKDKGFSIECQDQGKLFVRVWQGKRAMAVPLFAQDMYAVVALLLRQMVKNQPFLGVDGVIAIVRQLSSVYQEAGMGVQPMQARAA